MKNKNLVPYIIVAPNFRRTSAGIVLLYKLAELLGTLATVNTAPPADGRFIAVYPRIYAGNQWNAPLVVRYIMSNLDLYPDPVPDIPELVFTYSDSFRPDLKPLGKLFLPTVELELFENANPQPRSGFCYFHGKGGTSSIPPTGAKMIDNDWPPTRAELAQVLKTSEALYCDDPLTSLALEAVLCGCEVVCPGIKWISELGKNPTADGLRDKIMFHRREVLPAQIENFINITQEAYGRL